MTSATAALAAVVAPAAPPPPPLPAAPAGAGAGPEQGAEPSDAATDDEQPESLGLGLELDLWEGQFEFVGPDYGEHAPLSLSPALSLSPSPTRGLKFGSNGIRKNEARAWCEELTEQKAVLEHSSCEDLISMWHALLEKSGDADLLKVQLLQQQVSVLADNQTNTDDRYTRAKQDSAALQARVHMLEEQLREAELRAEERLQEEQRRHREMMARVDREKELHVENYSIRLQTLELEASSLREETSRLRAQMERLRVEKAAAEERLAEAEATAATLQAEALAVRDAERRSREEAVREQAASSQLVEELSRDLEQLRKERGVSNPADSQHSAHLAELQSELSRLRQENKNLRETNEDLQAQILTRGVEEGRNLLGTGNSIAAELEAMSGEELSGSTLGHQSYEKMRIALKEQQEVNTQLRSYIDGMLLNIVENYPQLLEVKGN